MAFVTFAECAQRIRGRSVAVVGSGPGCLDNEPGWVDGHDLVCRVNNYKTGALQGLRCDIHYSFYGTSIRKSAEQLQRDGVTLCMCKLPDGRPLESDWHVQRGKLEGIDYRYIYRNRAAWWFCDVFVPTEAQFLEKFNLLGRHQPTTGFAAILDILACEPRSVYLTGFDGFQSGVHNVDEVWHHKNNGDPICHRPDLEAAWIRDHAHLMTFDAKLADTLRAME